MHILKKTLLSKKFELVFTSYNFVLVKKYTGYKRQLRSASLSELVKIRCYTKSIGVTVVNESLNMKTC